VSICSPANNETYQERLLRLEGDKESLVLQVSVLTDQVEAQGEKIRDLETSLEEHRQKLASTEEMLQQIPYIHSFTYHSCKYRSVMTNKFLALMI
ncbi:Liprin-beta-1, partial [Ilyodon furcidens]